MGLSELLAILAVLLLLLLVFIALGLLIWSILKEIRDTVKKIMELLDNG